MCKSKFHGGPHCDESPEKRRIRQRLGYHVNKAGNGDIGVLLPEVENRQYSEPVASSVALLEHDDVGTAVDEAFESSTIVTEEVVLPDVSSAIPDEIPTVVKTRQEIAQELATTLNAQVTDASSDEGYFLNGKEFSEENLLKGVAEREQQITYLGSLIGSRADEIAGMTPLEAQETWQARVDDSRAGFEQAVVDYDASQKLHAKTLDDIRAKYRVGTSISPLSDEDQAIVDASKKRHNEEFDRTEAIKLAHGMLAQGFDAESQATLKKLSEANLQAIAEVRTLGGDIRVTDNSSKRALNVIKDHVAPILPKQWIEKDSLNSEPIRIKDTTGRAHFSHGTEQETRKTVPSELSRGLAPGVEIDRENEIYKDWRKTDETRKDGSVVWRGPEYEVLNSREYPTDGRAPKGRGWEVKQVENMNLGSPKYVQAWVRAKNTTVSVASVGQPELLVPAITKNRRDANETFARNRMISIARHEAVHGIAERSNPHIATLEAKFLERRTTNSDGTRDRLEKYNGSATEKTRPDNFVNAYMGKEYTHGKAYEILTTGTEALFNGQYGGLTGIGTKRSDPDMRNFVLGIYAAA